LTVFLSVLTQNILPIALVASFGYLLRRYSQINLGTLTSVVFNVLSPCLVFSALVTSQLPGGELLELAAFSALSILGMGALALLLARLLRLGRAETAAVVIVAMFANGGNYGLTLLQLRYGDAGLSRGVVYFVTSTVIFYTLGVLIASLGRLTWREALRRMTRVPAFYAALLAVVVYSLRIPIPAPILSGVTIAGQGAIPIMLIILGMQIADMRRGETTGYVWPAVGLRLVVGPLLGVAVAALLGLSGVGRSAMIVEAAMPPAVFCLILAAEFGLPTAAVARIVVFATLLSPFTVAATITLLGL
jgi:predicted permease